MRSSSVVLIAGVMAWAQGGLSAQGISHLRGDSNGSGDVDISDPLHILNYLFSGGPSPRCRAEADANQSGTLDISDALALFNFLFSGGGGLPALTADEERACFDPWVVRRGNLVGILPHVNEVHGVSGVVEQLSNHTLRIREFYYDGEGGGRTYVWLHRGGDMRSGRPISPSIRKPYPGYINETIEYPIPESIADETFHSVAIWCFDFDQNFGSARLVAVTPE